MNILTDAAAQGAIELTKALGTKVSPEVVLWVFIALIAWLGWSMVKIIAFAHKIA